jgi:HD-GYP domain-containing protein (c-di-GMP phosphodiesterase class II)
VLDRLAAVTDDIIDEAKVIAVADVLDAITSHRPYRPGLGIEVALKELERGSGTAYDPAIVDVCTKLVRDEGFRWHRDNALVT